MAKIQEAQPQALQDVMADGMTSPSAVLASAASPPT